MTDTRNRRWRALLAALALAVVLIATAATTDVEFTTPNPAVYEGRLLSAEDDTVLDTMVVRVQAAGAVQP